MITQHKAAGTLYVLVCTVHCSTVYSYSAVKYNAVRMYSAVRICTVTYILLQYTVYVWIRLTLPVYRALNQFKSLPSTDCSLSFTCNYEH